MAKKVTTTTTVTTVTTTTTDSQHDYILIDRSGSMASIWGDTLGGVNTYVKTLAKDDATKGILVTVAVFDSNDPFHILRKAVPASEWQDITEHDAYPRGMTPLFDAIGQLVALAKRDAPEKSAIVITTDGHENASQEYKKDTIKKLLDECRAKNWQVIFLGANFDNMDQASSLGNVQAMSMSYAAQNTTGVFRSMASTRAVYSSGMGSMSFSDEDRKNATAPDPKAQNK